MKKTKQIFIYPGSFDPCTLGHLDLIFRGAKVCDQLIVAVANNPKKKSMFTVEERTEFLKKSISRKKSLSNVHVAHFNGLLVKYAKKIKATGVLRGLRAVADYEFEKQLAHMNKKLSPNMETIFMMTGEEHFYVSSSLVKEIAVFGGKIDEFVPKIVAKAMYKKVKEQGGPLGQ